MSRAERVSIVSSEHLASVAGRDSEQSQLGRVKSLLLHAAFVYLAATAFCLTAHCPLLSYGSASTMMWKRNEPVCCTPSRKFTLIAARWPKASPT